MHDEVINTVGKNNIKIFEKKSKLLKIPSYVILLTIIFIIILLFITLFESKFLYYSLFIMSVGYFVLAFPITTIKNRKLYINYILKPMLENMFTNVEINKTSISEQEYINTGLSLHKKKKISKTILKFHDVSSLKFNNKLISVEMHQINILYRLWHQLINTLNYPGEQIFEKCIIIQFKNISKNLDVNLIRKLFDCNDKLEYSITNNVITLKFDLIKLNENIVFFDTTKRGIKKNFELFNYVKTISDKIMENCIF